LFIVSGREGAKMLENRRQTTKYSSITYAYPAQYPMSDCPFNSSKILRHNIVSASQFNCIKIIEA